MRLPFAGLAISALLGSSAAASIHERRHNHAHFHRSPEEAVSVATATEEVSYVYTTFVSTWYGEPGLVQPSTVTETTSSLTTTILKPTGTSYYTATVTVRPVNSSTASPSSTQSVPASSASSSSFSSSSSVASSAPASSSVAPSSSYSSISSSAVAAYSSSSSSSAVSSSPSASSAPASSSASSSPASSSSSASFSSSVPASSSTSVGFAGAKAAFNAAGDSQASSSSSSSTPSSSSSSSSYVASPSPTSFATSYTKSAASSSAVTSASTSTSTTSSSSSSSPSASSNPGTISSNGNQWAITYTPYDSNGGCKDAGTVASDISAVKQAGFTSVRVYSTDCSTLAHVGSAARQNGLKLVLGIFISSSGISGAGDQVSAIEDWAQWDLTELIVIGNEAVFNGYVSASDLAGFITSTKSQFQRAGYSGPVTTTEPLNVLQSNADTFCNAVDVISSNLHPFFNSQVSADKAGSFVASQFHVLEQLCPNKPAYNLETGWPSYGTSSNGAAVPGEQEQKTAIAAIANAAGSRSVMFSFENDMWKQPGEFGVERSWGCHTLFG